jgi:hypothetical protein
MTLENLEAEVLLYRISEEQIRVLAVVHHERKPQYWVDRQ